MKRSKQTITIEAAHPSNLHDPRVETSRVCEADLLRILSLPASSSSSSGPAVLDRVHLARVAAKLRHGSDQYALLRFSDSVRHLVRRHVTVHDADWSTSVNSFTLDSFRACTDHLSFFSDIAAVRDPLTSLFNKTLNSRCQTRKYGTVAEKALFETEKETKKYQKILAEASPCRNESDAKRVDDYRAIHTRREQFRRLILCSLLGNYDHCTSRIVHPRARQALHRITAPDGLAFFQSLLHVDKAWLVVWCVRDCLVRCILDDPALHAQVKKAIHFDDFRRLTNRAMAVLRAYLERALLNPHTSLYKHITSPSGGGGAELCVCLQHKNRACLYESITWLHDTTRLLEPFHAFLLSNVQYKKPKVDVVQWLVSSDARKVNPLTQRRLSPEEALEKETRMYDSDEEEREDALSSDMWKRIGTIQGSRLMDKILSLRTAKIKEAAAVAQDADATSSAHAYLTAAQFQALRQLCSREHDLGAVVECWRGTGFGATDVEIDFIHSLLELHRSNDAAKLARKKMLAHLQERAPHASNLLQIAASLLKKQGADGDEGHVVGYFSMQTVQAQLRAAHTKVVEMFHHLQRCKMTAIQSLKKDCGQLDVSDALQECQDEIDRITRGVESKGDVLVEKASVSLHFCPVCSRVYSNVRSKYNPLMARYYRFGLRGASRRYSSESDVVCRNDVVNHIGSCRGQLLRSVNLVGVRFALRGRVYQLCVRCSDIMTPQVEDAVYCDEGQLCCQCAKKQMALEATSGLDSFLAGLDRRCVCCMITTTTDDSTHLYPFGICLCRHHSRPYMARFVDSKHWTSKHELREAIAKHFVDAKMRKQKRAQPAATRNMKAAKQRSRNHKA